MKATPRPQQMQANKKTVRFSSTTFFYIYISTTIMTVLNDKKLKIKFIHVGYCHSPVHTPYLLACSFNNVFIYRIRARMPTQREPTCNKLRDRLSDVKSSDAALQVMTNTRNCARYNRNAYGNFTWAKISSIKHKLATY
jgi:hypothetical protein